MLYFTLPSSKTLLHDAFGFQPHSSIIQQANNAFYFPIERTNRIIYSCWTPPIDSNNHAYLVSQRFVPEHSVYINNIFKCIKIFLHVPPFNWLLIEVDATI